MSGHGDIHWSELMTTDADSARAFYTALVGWNVQAMNMNDPSSEAGPGDPAYVIWMAGDKPAGGMFQMAGPDFDGVPPHWATYVHVDDVDAASARAADLGGTVHKPPFDVPGVGRIAIVADPQGAVLGLITPADAS